MVGEEVTTLGGHLLALYIDRPIRPYRSLRATIAAVHEAGGLAIPAHPLVPYPLCAQGWVLRRLLDDPDPAVRPDALETFNPTTLGRPAHKRVTQFADARGLAHLGNSDAHALAAIAVRLDDVFPGHDAADLRRAIEARTTEHGGTFHPTVGQLGTFGQQLRKRGRDARDELGGRLRRDGTGRDHGYPGGRLRPPRFEQAGPEERQRAVKIGLVCPYIYPESGGVAQHVRFLYENLRLRGHDVRIITASHGPQRASEGDILRIGVGFSMPTNGSVGTLTFSPRYIVQVRQLLERERFDLLHFHEPFVPFLSLFLLRESRSVNVATFHAYAGFSPSYELGSRVMGGYAARLHGRIAVSAAARHFIDRFFPGDYKVIPNGVDVPRFASAVPIARWQDGTPNVLFVGRHEPRKGLLDLLKAHRILRKTGAREPAPDRRLGTRRSARRAATSPPAGSRRSSSSVASRTPRRRSSSGRSTSSRRRPPAASRSGSCCSRRWPPARRSWPRTSTATRAWSGAVGKACWCRRTSQRSSPPRSPGCWPTRPSGREMSAAGRLRAEEFSWPRVAARVEEYYGFVIRRLAAGGSLPVDFTAPVPQAPPVRIRPSSASSAVEGATESASASRQTQVE